MEKHKQGKGDQGAVGGVLPHLVWLGNTKGGLSTLRRGHLSIDPKVVREQPWGIPGEHWRRSLQQEAGTWLVWLGNSKEASVAAVQ